MFVDIDSENKPDAIDNGSSPITHLKCLRLPDTYQRGDSRVSSLYIPNRTGSHDIAIAESNDKNQ
jgi:hypothetical protein